MHPSELRFLGFVVFLSQSSFAKKSVHFNLTEMTFYCNNYLYIFASMWPVILTCRVLHHPHISPTPIPRRVFLMLVSHKGSFSDGSSHLGVCLQCTDGLSSALAWVSASLLAKPCTHPPTHLETKSILNMTKICLQRAFVMVKENTRVFPQSYSSMNNHWRM